MHDKRDDYEPIIATRPSREPQREDTQPLWRLVLMLSGGLVVAALIAWWFLGRSNEGAPATLKSERSTPEIFQEERIEQEPAPPARDAETNADIAPAPAPPAPVVDPAAGAEQAATPEENSEVAPDPTVQTPAPPGPASVRFMSPDAQVQIELRGPPNAAASVVTNKVGDVVEVAPGTYRVVASGAQLETFEQEVTLDGERAYEYTVELCAERKQERESIAGKVVEERACASTAQCESMFNVLSEHADQLVSDRTFRAQQCAKWRPNAAPDGRWTLDTKCDGATLATTCRIEITEGVCMFAEPRRSVRGGACPQVELK